MSEKQPEARRLADILDKVGGQFPVEAKAAKELRRLHEVNVELLGALKNARYRIADVLQEDDGQAFKEARRALRTIDTIISKATKGQE